VARWTYAFSNGSYNDWHRKYDNIAMIDIDSIECCPDCYEPLAILETCYDKGQKYKATTSSETEFEVMNEQQWVSILLDLQANHRKVCKHGKI
jgi:hypothetical protein